LSSGNHSHVLDVLSEKGSELRRDQPRIIVLGILGSVTAVTLHIGARPCLVKAPRYATFSEGAARRS
jgi:hypothetical protein